MRGRALAPLVLGVAPWSWYAVRDVDPRLDAVALLWPVIGVAAIGLATLGALVLRSARAVAVALSWSLATSVIVVGPWRPLDTGTPGDGVRVVAANLFGDNTDASNVSSMIADERPALVVVSEVTDRSMPVLAERYREAVRDTAQDGEPGGVAVFSDLAISSGPLPQALRDQRGMRVEVDGPAGPFVLYALHLQKPGPSPSDVEVGFRTHRRIIDALVDAIAAEELPVIVAGDLNLIDRSSGYRALTGVLDDGLRSGWTGPTSLRRRTRLLLARVDHILVPEDWCASEGKTFTLQGSDHRAVATTTGPCR